MSRCFVIQPFDGGAFDKRFDDVLIPAIKSAGLEAYRVDRDPTVTVPVSAIEEGIRDASACIADISTDNPNVWFELGYALACGRPLLLICSAARSTPFPFDVQHRHVIVYRTDSPSDFAKLSTEIARRLGAALAKEQKVNALADAPLARTEGLEAHEITALVLIAEADLEPESAPSAFSIKQDMRKAGFTEIAAVLGVKALLRAGMVERVECSGGFNQDPYNGFGLTSTGAEWLLQNRKRLAMRRGPKQRIEERADPIAEGLELDDDLPF